MRSSVSAVVAALLAAASAGPAAAHDLWIERDGAAWVLQSGHRHSGHEGAETVAYAPETVKRVLCVSTVGGVSDLPLPATAPARWEGACAGFFVMVSSGYWTKTPYGTKNVPRDEAKQPVSSWLSFESVKRIASWTDALARPVGDGLEIVPLENPLLLKEGDKLHLLVAWNGKPVKGATVAYDGEPRGVTAEDGRIGIKLRHGGFQAVQAGLHVPVSSPKADEEIHTTALDFDLKEGR